MKWIWVMFPVMVWACEGNVDDSDGVSSVSNAANGDQAPNGSDLGDPVVDGNGDGEPVAEGETGASGDDTGQTDDTAGQPGGSTGNPDNPDMGAGQGGNPAAVVPDTAYCEPVTTWDAVDADVEQEMLELVNQYRAAGGDCGTKGSFAPAPPVSMRAELRCAARVHAKDMHDRDYFAHESPEGEKMDERVTRAGYDYQGVGETLYKFQTTAAVAVQAWMNSDGHCGIIMDGRYSEVGSAHHNGYWVLVFGLPK